MSRRRYFYTEVEVSLNEIDTTDLVEELKERAPDQLDELLPVEPARIERLYYATRAGEIPRHVTHEICALLADLYGRAA
jgi:hypothetical protein